MNFSSLYYRKSIKRSLFDFKYFLILVGLYTFTAKKNGNDDAVMNIRPKVYSVLHSTVVFTVVIGCFIKRLSLVDTVDAYSYYLHVGFYLILGVTTLLSAISFIAKSDLFVMFINRADALDLTLNQLNIRRNTNIFFWLFLSYLLAGCVSVCVVIIADRSAEKRLFDVFAGLAFVALRSTIFCLVILVVGFLAHRSYSVNLFLEELDDDIDMEIFRNEYNVHKKRRAQSLLNILTEILEELVDLSKLTKEIFSFVILCNVVLNVVQFSYSILFYYCGDFSELSIPECSIMLFTYNLQILTLYILCFQLEKEVTNIYVTLANLNIYCSSPDLALQKNTLLLQGLHNKIDMTIFGIIPLRASVFLEQIDICKTIILLLQQYHQRQNTT